MTDPDPVTLANTQVTDALVKFQLSCANNPDLFIFTKDSITNDDLEPLPVEPDWDPDDGPSYWLGQDDGVYRRFKDGPVGVPADEKPISKTTKMNHEDGSTSELVPDLNHTTAIHVNKDTDHEASVVRGDVHRFAVDPAKMYEIVERYVNGPLGSDYRSHVFKTREKGKYSWRRLQTYTEREDYAVADETDVVLVDNGRYGWYPRPVEDIPYKNGPKADDEVYEP